MTNHSISSPTMFKNPTLELLSKTPWYVVPIVWIPLAIYCIAHAISAHTLSLQIILFLGLCGIAVWTLTEYVFHRFVFHWQGQAPWAKRLHFIIHGVHHEFPNDRLRLVMPLSTSVLLALPFAGFYWVLLGPLYFFPFFGGFLLGYVYYDMTHYAVHHAKWKNQLFLKVKKHHLQHHHNPRFQASKFGVSSPLWDYLFGTTSDDKPGALPLLRQKHHGM